MAKSSFYLSFDSIEALYLGLVSRRTAETKRLVIDEASLKAADPPDGLRRFSADPRA